MDSSNAKWKFIDLVDMNGNKKEKSTEKIKNEKFLLIRKEQRTVTFSQNKRNQHCAS
ncbi:hypothetical protein T03_2481 [Trichinella britovi]|uniref:Uncharacterized protein n=1 Tax=Trichinella britovi TaxID=45882 RepID=A0A0V1C581_TRIBR|nr:hypothetical protein T03_2481 [Trichinella britovi]